MDAIRVDADLRPERYYLTVYYQGSEDVGAAPPLRSPPAAADTGI